MAGRGPGKRSLLANPALAGLATDLALKAGAFAIRRGADRLFAIPAAAAPTARKRGKAMLIAVPVGLVAGTGALGAYLFRRSQTRRKRGAGGSGQNKSTP